MAESSLKHLLAYELSKLRKLAGLTQVQLADTFNRSQSSVAALENGRALWPDEAMLDLFLFYQEKLGDKRVDVVQLMARVFQIRNPHAAIRMFESAFIEAARHYVVAMKGSSLVLEVGHDRAREKGETNVEG